MDRHKHIFDSALELQTEIARKADDYPELAESKNLSELLILNLGALCRR